MSSQQPLMNLRTTLTAKNLTQAELAEKAGSSSSMVSMILSGSRKPGPKLRKKICKALRMPSEILFAPEGDNNER